MARPHTKTGAGCITGIVLIAWALWMLPAASQDTPPQTPVTQECQRGGDSIAGESPLPNVAKALAERKSLNILTIGASATGGRRSTRGGYTRLIEEILEKAVKGLDVVMINRGVSGELAVNAAARIKNEVALERPDLVLWQVGTNDALAYVELSHITSVVVQTIHWLRDHKVDVILVGLQSVNRLNRDPHYMAVRDELRRIATQENVIIIRRDEAIQLIERGGTPPDEFERTEEGYTCLAQFVARAITVGVFGRGLRREPTR